MRKVLAFLIGIVFPFLLVAEEYSTEIEELKQKLIDEGVPETWITSNLENQKFKIYSKMPDYFKKMPEHQVSRKEKDFDWYKKYFDVENRIITGKQFLKDNAEVLSKIENNYGIHRELISAVIAIESNYGHNTQKGNFYTFGALVSQYVLVPRRQNFAFRELVALYKFTQKTQKDTYYFIGSYAGASGWGQFIPSSLLHYFKDLNDNDLDTDIYSLDDNLTSIASYLSAHRLDSKTMNDRIKIEDAVYAYNHSKHYVKAVMIIYDGLRKE